MAKSKTKSGQSNPVRRDSIFKPRRSKVGATRPHLAPFAHEAALIRSEFDVDFYVAQVPESAEAALDPVLHYLQTGWLKMLDPCREFSTSAYLDANPDVRDSAINPFVHYIEFGRAEGRQLKRPGGASHASDGPPSGSTARLAIERSVIAPEFDQAFYLSQFPKGEDAPADAVLHFLETGWREFDPSAEFSTKYYLANNPDVRESRVNPFLHYIEFGRAEGRRPRPPSGAAATLNPATAPPAGRNIARERATIAGDFDVDFYVQQMKTPPDPAIDPVVHYLESGWVQRLDPCPGFSTRYYLEHNRDVRESGVNPFVHYVEFGRREGRKPQVEIERFAADSPSFVSPVDRMARDWSIIAGDFDVEFYLKRAPDLQASGLDPIMHYLDAGWRELRDPSPEFSTAYYLKNNPEVRAKGINPFVHYIQTGKRENRPPKMPATQAKPGRAGVAPPARPQAAVPLPGPGERHARERALIAKEFDVDFYLSRSPDLKGATVDPITHYLDVGWRELRDPSSKFSTAYYLKVNPRIRERGINPFVHYIEFGRKEGRLPKPTGTEAPIAAGQPSSAASSPAPVLPGRFDRERELIASAFDVEFYMSRSPDLKGSSIDPIVHFLEAGWREMRDPSPDFSTAYYLEANPDIRAGGVNPFVHYIEHGKREGRAALPFSVRKLRRQYNPLVTAIVPNFNHARFLEHRLDSILGQTYKNLEIVILDDCSSDNSVEGIERYRQNHPERIRTLINTTNSGNVFKQWRKGIENAAGELFWICESDDFCDLNFLENCVRPFVDSSVMISFARVQFSDEAGKLQDGLDAYRERAEPGIWDKEIVRPASEWFRRGFGIANLIPNVGGCLIRRQQIPDGVWNEAIKYRICGDWYLYSVLGGGGQICYVPAATTYFRQHGKNTSVTGFRRPHFYSEHEMVMTALRRRWGTPDEIALKFFDHLLQTYNYSKARQAVGPITELCSIDRVLSTERTGRHILIAILGFHLGGGEIIPIHLANELVRTGHIVSVFCLSSQGEHAVIRRQLDDRIAVYESEYVAEIGVTKFLESTGVDVIHSHYVGIEYFFFDKRGRLPPGIPYVVTLHGSYECTTVPDATLLRIIRGVTHWCYLSKKNLGHLEGIPLAPDRVSSVGNSMPIDARDFPQSRDSLGIGPEDLLFTLASRAIKEKGWRVAIEALRRAQRKTSRALHLMLCGFGPEDDALRLEFGDEPRVHFMGFQEQIHGAYRISDVAILPTRFPGESFPMAVVQALQVGTPVIATDIGEVRRIMSWDSDVAGVIVPRHEDDDAFADLVAAAMVRMTDDTFRGDRATAAKGLGAAYDMAKVAEHYVGIYRTCIEMVRPDSTAG